MEIKMLIKYFYLYRAIQECARTLGSNDSIPESLAQNRTARQTPFKIVLNGEGWDEIYTCKCIIMDLSKP